LLAYRSQVVDERLSGLAVRFASLRKKTDEDADDNSERKDLRGVGHDRPGRLEAG
jgi:hypothetical protein